MVSKFYFTPKFWASFVLILFYQHSAYVVGFYMGTKWRVKPVELQFDFFLSQITVLILLC